MRSEIRTTMVDELQHIKIIKVERKDRAKRSNAMVRILSYLTE